MARSLYRDAGCRGDGFPRGCAASNCTTGRDVISERSGTPSPNRALLDKTARSFLASRINWSSFTVETRGPAPIGGGPANAPARGDSPAARAIISSASAP